MVRIGERLLNRTVFFTTCGEGTTNAEKARIAAKQGNMVRGILSNAGEKAYEELTHSLGDKGKKGKFQIGRNLLGRPIGLVYKPVGPRTPEEKFDIHTAGVRKGQFSGRDLRAASVWAELDPSLTERFNAIFDDVRKQISIENK